MAGRALLEGTKGYLGFLLRTLVFPFIWAWAATVARENHRDDPHGRTKVGAAIVVGIVLAAGVGLFLWDFEQDSRAGMYDALDNRLAGATGEAAYDEQSSLAQARAAQAATIGGTAERKGSLEEMRDEREGILGRPWEDVTAADLAALDEEQLANVTSLSEDIVELEMNLRVATLEMELAERNAQRLQEEHRFYERLRPVVQAQDDARARGMIAARVAAMAPGAFEDEAETLVAAEAAEERARRDVIAAQAEVERLEDAQRLGTLSEEDDLPAARAGLEDAEAKLTQAAEDVEAARGALAGAPIELPTDPDVYDADRMGPRSDRAFAIKDSADEDMVRVMWYLLYPGVIGVFFGPMFVALGSIMANAWESSETVGFKKYPGAALGLFLLMGAFGWPSLVFAAWGFRDIAIRHREGQISL